MKRVGQGREQEKVDAWNARVPVGAPVRYQKDTGSAIDTTTRSAAEVLSGHTAVIWLNGVSGCVALDRVSERGRDQPAVKPTKLTLEPTANTVTIETKGVVPLHLWQGETESGTPVLAFIAQVETRDARREEIDPSLSAVAQALSPSIEVTGRVSSPRAGELVLDGDVHLSGGVQLVETGAGLALDALATALTHQLVQRLGLNGALAAIDRIRKAALGAVSVSGTA